MALVALLSAASAWLSSGVAVAQEVEATDGVEVAGPEEGDAELPQEAPPPTRESLLESLSSPEPPERVSAIRALSGEVDPEVIERLALIAREDPVAEVRGWALRGLYQINTPESRLAGAEAARLEGDDRVLALAERLFPPVVQARAAAEGRMAVAQGRRVALAQGRRVAQHRDDELVERAPPPPPDPGRTFRIGGWATFGISYAAAFSLGLVSLLYNSAVGGLQLIPFVGSAIAMGAAYDDDLLAIFGVAITMGVAQIVGFVVAMIGQARTRRSRLEREETADRASVEGRLSFRGAGL